MFSVAMPSEAQKKFWKCPELVDSVLPFLDSYSTLQLAKVCPMRKKNTVPMIFDVLNSNQSKGSHTSQYCSF